MAQSHKKPQSLLKNIIFTMIDKKHIEKEKNRSIDNLNRIFLYKDENSGWYRAHEWSAYLVEFYNRNIDKKDRLKPIHKMFT